MKGRVIALGEVDGRGAAALIVDGTVEDLLIDPAGETPVPGAIYRAAADRPLKGQGGMILRLGGGQGFFRNAKGLKPGQMLTVQVTSIAEPGKAPPVSDRVLFKGRSAIVTPGAPGLNISRRIRDEEERVRLHDIASESLAGRDYGLILRSSATEIPDDDIADEIAGLVTLADQVMGDRGTAPEQLLEGPGAHDLAWREWSVPAPDAVEDAGDVFDRLGVWDMIEQARGPGKTLPRGASMFVEPTRALVAVDVNTGGDMAPGAALQANLAAARALPRALRLRGLGGQVVVDFAPLPKKDRKSIEQALRAAFRADPVETTLVGWTPLGHYELQRKRERFPLVP